MREHAFTFRIISQTQTEGLIKTESADLSVGRRHLLLLKPHTVLILSVLSTQSHKKLEAEILTVGHQGAHTPLQNWPPVQMSDGKIHIKVDLWLRLTNWDERLEYEIVKLAF